MGRWRRPERSKTALQASRRTILETDHVLFFYYSVFSNGVGVPALRSSSYPVSTKGLARRGGTTSCCKQGTRRSTLSLAFGGKCASAGPEWVHTSTSALNSSSRLAPAMSSSACGSGELQLRASGLTWAAPPCMPRWRMTSYGCVRAFSCPAVSSKPWPGVMVDMCDLLQAENDSILPDRPPWRPPAVGASTGMQQACVRVSSGHEISVSCEHNQVRS